MKPMSVTPTLAPREADDTAICARASLAGPSGYEHRSAASPPAARDGRGRLRRDGPRAGLGSCSGRSSSSRLPLRWTRASLVVLALLALIVAPGTTFVAATESGKGPRGRRLAQANPVPSCDASAPPANGAVGDCDAALLSGTTCQPACDEHYTVSGVTKCVDGTLIPAQCLGPCDMDTCCYFYNKRRGFNVPGTCAHLEYMTPSPPPPPPSAPSSPAPFRTVNERVLVQDQDGWLLMAAYNHQAGTNPDLVEGTAPSSATEGFSHVWPGTHLGLTASDIAEVRFYCHTSNHNRIMHFSVNNDWIKTAILTGSVSGNSVSYWKSGTTKLAGHTAKLPDSTTHVQSSSRFGLLDVPFFEWGAGSWRLRDYGGTGASNWECDNIAAGTTSHQVWIKLAE